MRRFILISIGLLLITNSCKQEVEDIIIPLPEVTTSTISSISVSTATTGGVATGDGITARGVVYSKNASPDLKDMFTSNGEGEGSFTSNLLGLEENTTYFVRSYATNETGTSFGTERSFTTEKATTLATLKIDFSTQYVTHNSLTRIVGSVEDDGGLAIKSYGFVYAKQSGVTVDDTKVGPVSTNMTAGRTEFTSSISNLSPETKYYIRAYAINDKGTAYSVEHTFTTTKIPDTSPPTIVSNSPYVGESAIDYSENIVIEFSEPLKSSTVNASNFKLVDENNNSVNTSISLSSDGKTVTLNPVNDLKGGFSLYRYIVSNQVQDLAGNKLANELDVYFYTKNSYITEPHWSVETYNVKIDEDITLTFNAAIDPETVNSTTVYIRRSNANSGISSTLTVNGDKIIISPNTALTEFETAYVITVRNTIRDTRGNIPISAFDFLFFTEAVSENYIYNIEPSTNTSHLLGDAVSPYQLFYLPDGNYCNAFWVFDKRNDGTYTITHNCTPSTQYLEGGNINAKAYMGPGVYTGQLWYLIKDARSSGSKFYSLRNKWLGNNYSLDSGTLGMIATNTNKHSQYWDFVRVQRR